MFRKFLLISFLAFLGYFSSDAQVMINEFSASNLESFVDEFGKTEDWIELYNDSEVIMDLSGWHLSDKEDNPTKYEIPSGISIQPFSHLVFLCSGRDLVGNEHIHTNFKLSQTSGTDVIILADNNGNVQEQYEMPITLVEHSLARISDGSNAWKVCTEPTFGTSNDDAPMVNGYTATPSMNLEAGFYQDQVTVEITNNEPNSVLRYTLNGDNPTSDSPIYGEAINIDETTVVKAQAFSNDENILPGKMDFNTYFIDEDEFTVAVFSIAADEVINLANGEGDLIPIGSLEYFNLDKEREAVSYGSLNRHGQDSWALPHRSIDWISRDEMGYSKAVLAPIFSTSDRDEYQKFMFRNSGDDNYPALPDEDHEGATHIRDEYVHTLAEEGNMEVDVRTVERVVVFLNGEYWGLYGMRERPVDHDYTKEYYDQDKYHLQYLSTWGDTEAEYGGEQAFFDWEDTRNFILENDMSDPANYTQVTEGYNVLSLIDYMLVNLNTVARDWLNYNTGWWRGLDPEGGHKKWGYIVWDMDATFDYYINYTGVPNVNPDAVPCDIDEISDYMDEFFGDISDLQNTQGVDYSDCPSILSGDCPHPADDPLLQVVFVTNQWGQNGTLCCDNWTNGCNQIYNWAENGWISNQGNVGAHEKIWDKLLSESPEFSELFAQRYADIMNTVYSCENMIETLDRMLAVIEPEMDRQIDRWGGTRAEWESNVEDLKDFINERCTLLDDGMVECYDVTGPYEITLLTQPDLVGEIDFNTLDVREFPWQGEYFGEVENYIKARVFDEYLDSYVFSHWERASGEPILPNDQSFEAAITLTQADTLVAVFDNITNIEEIEKEHQLMVYPNPATSYINVDYMLPQSANVRIELQSLLGQEVIGFNNYEGKRAAGHHQQVLPLSENIASGMYLLHIQIDEATIVKKVKVIK